LRHVDASVREPPRERGTARVFGRGAVTRSPDASSPTRLDQSWSAAARTVGGPASPACRRTSCSFCLPPGNPRSKSLRRRLDR